ncbi:MAG TPA: iron-containing alcohol dehydrogenase [Candidatus Treponema faecavium]|nr:iron-containing alcohol dehydrogenase [Candidatus Treponema faecavium]
MADLCFELSPRIVVSSYGVSRLGAFLSDLGKRWIVVLDPSLRETNIVKTVQYSLDNAELHYFIFDNIGPRAKGDSEIIADAAALASQAGIDGVAAIGGSRALNVGRFLAALYGSGKSVYDCLDAGEIDAARALPVVCVPSTAKNAHMFTSIIPAADARSRQLKLVKLKNGGGGSLVLMDSQLLVSLTDNQIVSAAMEILCLAAEAYLSDRASFFSDMFAEKSVSLLGSYFAADTAGSGSEELLTEAGCAASLACAASAAGAASLVAMTANARFSVQKSHTAAILLPYLIEDAVSYKAAQLDALSRLIGVAKADGTREENAALFAGFIRDRMASAHLPARLKDLNISIDELAAVVEDAGRLEAMNSLQRSMTADDLFSLVKRAF